MCIYIYISLVGGWAAPLKNMSSSIGMISNPIYGKIKLMFQTTNQFIYIYIASLYIYIWIIYESGGIPHLPSGKHNYGKSLFLMAGWWLGHPSEKYEFVNWDD